MKSLITLISCNKYILVQVSFYVLITWWVSLLVESPRAHTAKLYCRLLMIRSALRASKFSVLKLINFLWVDYIIPFCFTDTFGTLLLNFWNYFVRRRITDEGLVPEIRIWSTLLIKSELKWCIRLRRRLFLYSKRFGLINHTLFRVHLSAFRKIWVCT